MVPYISYSYKKKKSFRCCKNIKGGVKEIIRSGNHFPFPWEKRCSTQTYPRVKWETHTKAEQKEAKKTRPIKPFTNNNNKRVFTQNTTLTKENKEQSKSNNFSQYQNQIQRNQTQKCQKRKHPRKVIEGTKLRKQENPLDLLVDGGLTINRIPLTGERILWDDGHHLKLLLHFFKGFKDDTRKRLIIGLPRSHNHHPISSFPL